MKKSAEEGSGEKIEEDNWRMKRKREGRGKRGKSERMSGMVGGKKMEECVERKRERERRREEKREVEEQVQEG